MEQQLQRLLKPMDLPEFRKSKTTVHNFKWLKQNLSVRNETHPNYKPAMEILNKLVN